MFFLVPLKDTLEARDLFEVVEIKFNTFTLNLVNILD